MMGFTWGKNLMVKLRNSETLSTVAFYIFRKYVPEKKVCFHPNKSYKLCYFIVKSGLGLSGVGPFPSYFILQCAYITSLLYLCEDSQSSMTHSLCSVCDILLLFICTEKPKWNPYCFGKLLQFWSTTIQGKIEALNIWSHWIQIIGNTNKISTMFACSDELYLKNGAPNLIRYMMFGRAEKYFSFF